MTKAFIHIDPSDPSPTTLMEHFAEVFVALDEHPRRLMLSIVTESNLAAAPSIEIVKGEPVIRMDGMKPAYGDFHGRWLAEHHSPLHLPARGKTCLTLIPTTGGRIKVRKAGLYCRFAGALSKLLHADG